VKFVFIAAEKAWASVTTLCRVLEVSRSGFYAWEDRDPSKHSMVDDKLCVEIVAIHKASRGTYGSPRVHAELQALGIAVSRKRVARLESRKSKRSAEGKGGRREFT
jgi:hypothetical protein